MRATDVWALTLRLTRYASALVVPLVLHGLWLVLLKEAGPASFPGPVGVLMLVLSVGAGFAFLKDDLNDKRAVLVAAIYFPVMAALLTYAGLLIGVQFYGEGP
jgi:hypothetical protein